MKERDRKKAERERQTDKERDQLEIDRKRRENRGRQTEKIESTVKKM